MNVKAFKYLSPISIFVLAYLAFTKTGLWVWGLLIFTLLIIPLAELIIKPGKNNFDLTEE